MVITIDGPVASGKSTTAKLLSKKLGFHYLNTGLLYRAVAYLLLKLGKDLSKNFSESDLDFIKDITYKFADQNPKIYFNNDDITPNLYTGLLDQPASIISKNSILREKLLILQRKVADSYSIIADGRDCGSVVFPLADFKFYLTANVDVRAKRMQEDLVRKNSQMSFEQIKSSIIERDKRDMEREIAPLIIPKGGIIIDNSDMSIEDTIEKIESIIKKG